MRKVIFLDRDGVINKERGDYTYKIADFELNEGVIDFMKKAQKQGFEFVSKTPKKGADNKMIVFLHPNSTNGVLIELCEEI